MTTTFTGFRSTATLDPAAGTVTFVHAGLPGTRKKTWVVPVGAIESIEVKKKTLMQRAHVRLLLHGRAGYDRLATEDPNCVLVAKEDPTEFVAAIEAARVGVPPVLDFAVEQQPAAAAAAPAVKPITFAGIEVTADTISQDGVSYPLKGARAVVDTVDRRGMTASRVALGTVIAPGVGTIVGAMAKKNKGSVFVTVTLADGRILVGEAKAKEDGDARRFAAELTNRGL